MSPAEAVGAVWKLESAHRPRPSSLPAMILLQMIVLEFGGTVLNRIPEHLLDGWRAAGVLVRRNRFGHAAGDRHRRMEELFGGHLAAVFAEGDIDQGAIAVDRPVQVAPAPADLQVRLIDVPVPPHRTAPAAPESISEHR